MDLRAVTFPSILDFDRLISELLGRVCLSSASDPEVFDVRESFEAELRSFAVYALRLPSAFSAILALLLAKFERPTAVAVEPVPFRPPNNGGSLFTGTSGE